MDAHTTTATATRTYNDGRATVTVNLEDGTTWTTTGKNAANAQAVLLGAFRPGTELGALGVRGDAAAARKEAHRLATETERKLRGRISGGKIQQVTPYHRTAVVEVVDA